MIASVKALKGRRRWLQFRLRSLFLAIAVVALVSGLATRYKEHLLWRLYAARNGLANLKAVSVISMPDAPSPENWVRCRFGTIEFNVPRELACTAAAGPNGTSALVMRDNSRTLIVCLPARKALSTPQRADESLPVQGCRLSTVRLRLACLAASCRDFDWSMSSEEVRWLAWRVYMGRVMRRGTEERGESLFRDDLEGVLYSYGTLAEFDWQVKDSEIGGNVQFLQGSGQQSVDLTWVRAICRSLTCAHDSYIELGPNEEIMRHFQIIRD